MALDLQPHRLSTAEYERLIDSGALADMDVELLDGLLVDMSPEGEVHWRLVNRLHKRPDHADLVVEVAISSLAHDRYTARVYARAGIPRYWLVDVNGGVVLDHSHPGDNSYARIEERRGPDVLDAHVEGIATTTVAELLAGT